jgi:23S rRNA G2445 N2-methylase RlmL
LASSLLMLAGVREGDAVIDPFMGTGTILEVAHELFGASMLIGADTDPDAHRRASERLQGQPARLYRESFASLFLGRLPRTLRLVSNLPFGERFAPVPTDDLLEFLARLLPLTSGVALLLGRPQAKEITARLRLRSKNVLVLGQPAAIVASRG